MYYELLFIVFFLMKDTVLFPGDDLMRRAAKWRRLKMHVRFNCFAYKQMLLCLPKLLFIVLLPLTCLILPCYVYFIVCLYIFLHECIQQKGGEENILHTLYK